MDCPTGNSLCDKDRIAELEKQLAISNSKVAVYEARRAKLPLKRYVIHRCVSYEFVKTIEAPSCREAKDIAEATEFNEIRNDDSWKCIKHQSYSFKKKNDKPELIKEVVEEVEEEEEVVEEVEEVVEEEVEAVDTKKNKKKNKKKKNK